MQTIPVFAYLVPILFLFGFGPTAAVVATLIYRHAADDPHHAAGAAPGADGSARPGPDDRLHAAADDMAGAGAVGPGRADGRRQSGDHAVAQHGDHRLDDRRGRAWGSTCWRRCGVSISAPGWRPGSPSSRWPSRSTGSARPLPARPADRSGRKATGSRGTPTFAPAPSMVLVAGLAGLLVSGGADLSRGPGADHRHVLVARRRMDQRQLLRHAGGDQERASAEPADPVQALSARTCPGSGSWALLALAGWRLGGLRLAAAGRVLDLSASPPPGLWEKAMITVYLCGISTVIAVADRRAHRYRRGRARQRSGAGCRW